MTREVPLTGEQRMWLRMNLLLPTVFLIASAIITIILIVLVSGPVLRHPVVRVFAAIAALLFLGVAIAVAMHVRNNRADLRRGTATVARVRLQRKHQTSRSPYTFYAVFDGIGQVIVMGDVYARIEEGKTYEVTFSPHTCRAWSVSP